MGTLERYLKKLESEGFLKKEKIVIDQVRALLISAAKNIFASAKNLSIDEEVEMIIDRLKKKKLIKD